MINLNFRTSLKLKNKMKKFFGLMLLCAAVIGFVSCQQNDEEFSPNHIIGTWETTQVYIGGDWVDIPYDSEMYATMTFNVDGSYYGDSDLFGSGYGTYTLSGNSLKTYYEGKLFYTYTIKSLTTMSAEVSMSYKNSNIGLRLKKVFD